MMKLHSTMSTIQGDTSIYCLFSPLEIVATIQKYTMQVVIYSPDTTFNFIIVQ